MNKTFCRIDFDFACHKFVNNLCIISKKRRYKLEVTNNNLIGRQTTVSFVLLPCTKSFLVGLFCAVRKGDVFLYLMKVSWIFTLDINIRTTSAKITPEKNGAKIKNSATKKTPPITATKRPPQKAPPEIYIYVIIAALLINNKHTQSSVRFGLHRKRCSYTLQWIYMCMYGYNVGTSQTAPPNDPFVKKVPSVNA